MYTWEDHEKRIYQKIGYAFTGDEFVLDVGCGGGTMSYLVAQYANRVIGIDIQPNSDWVKHKQNSINLEFKIADACKLPFEDNMFDVVTSKDLLHHVKNPEAVVSEMKRVAKNGALVIIIESNRYNPIKYIFLTKLRGPEEHLTKGQFKQLITSKFTNIEFKSFEDHYYPAKTGLGRCLLFALDEIFEKTPLLNKLLGYNVAIAKK